MFSLLHVNLVYNSNSAGASKQTKTKEWLDNKRMWEPYAEEKGNLQKYVESSSNQLWLFSRESIVIPRLMIRCCTYVPNIIIYIFIQHFFAIENNTLITGWCDRD
jgi:hypothetical protein